MACLLTQRVFCNLVPQENSLSRLEKPNVFLVYLHFHPAIYARYILAVSMAYLYNPICRADVVDKPNMCIYVYAIYVHNTHAQCCLSDTHRSVPACSWEQAKKKKYEESLGHRGKFHVIFCMLLW